MGNANQTVTEIFLHLLKMHPELVQHAGGLEIEGTSRLNVVDSFPLYQPCSAGTYADRARLAVQTINQLPGALAALATSVGYRASIQRDLTDAAEGSVDPASLGLLKSLLDRHGSDKATVHNYHLLYGRILSNRAHIENVLEIGLGTNNTDVVSHMGSKGVPGASLRAFRDYLPNAHIYGADVDRRVLFSEDRITTFHVDQTQRSSFQELGAELPREFDLMIDDGLHAPNANVHSLEFFLSRLKVGGWAIVEDIGRYALPVWELVGSLLPARFESTVFRTQAALVFAVERKA